MYGRLRVVDEFPRIMAVPRIDGCRIPDAERRLSGCSRMPPLSQTEAAVSFAKRLDIIERLRSVLCARYAPPTANPRWRYLSTPERCQEKRVSAAFLRGFQRPDEERC